MKVTVRYFAIFREERGLAEETLVTDAQTAAQLYAELRDLHRFRLEQPLVRAAINGEYREWDAPLSDGDVVVLIPPVAGG